jgi:hypothetical protein
MQVRALTSAVVLGALALLGVACSAPTDTGDETVDVAVVQPENKPADCSGTSCMPGGGTGGTTGTPACQNLAPCSPTDPNTCNGHPTACHQSAGWVCFC